MRKRKKETLGQKTRKSVDQKKHKSGMKIEGINLAAALRSIAHLKAGKYLDDLNADIRILWETASCIILPLGGYA